MARANKQQHDTLELCAKATEKLKAVGFEPVAVSMKSEAVYLRLPGRHGLLRVSAHRSARTPWGLGKVVAKLTFHGNRFDGAAVLCCSPEKIDTMIWIAVGQYIMGSSEPHAPLYHGMRPRKTPSLSTTPDSSSS